MERSRAPLQLPEIAFTRISLREIGIWTVFLLFVVVVQSLIVWQLSFPLFRVRIDTKDAVFSLIQTMEFFVLWAAWFFRKCQSVGIRLAWLSGSIPKGYDWRHWVFACAIVLALRLLGRGLARLYWNGVALVFPPFVERYLVELNAPDRLSQTVFPLQAQLLDLVGGIGFTAIYLFCMAFFLHQLPLRFGKTSALIAISTIVPSFALFRGDIPGFASGITWNLVVILLYLASQTILVPFVAVTFWSFILRVFSFAFPTRVNTIADLQVQWWQGIVYLAIAVPILAWFFYRNRRYFAEPFPYYKNYAVSGLSATRGTNTIGTKEKDSDWNE